MIRRGNCGCGCCGCGFILLAFVVGGFVAYWLFAPPVCALLSPARKIIDQRYPHWQENFSLSCRKWLPDLTIPTRETESQNLYGPGNPPPPPPVIPPQQRAGS